MGELTGAVGAKVRVDDRVAVADGRIDPVDDGRLDELVVLSPLVRLLQGRARGLGVAPFSVHDRVIAALDPVPALVAVHGEIPAADRGDAGIRMCVPETPLQVRDEPHSGARGRVTAVEQGMDANPRHAPVTSELGEGDEVTIVGVDAARADETDHVEVSTPGRGTRRGR